MANEDIFRLWRKVQEHPEFVFGTIFVRSDFPEEEVPEDFPGRVAEGQLAELGNEIIYNES